MFDCDSLNYYHYINIGPIYNVLQCLELCVINT